MEKDKARIEKILRVAKDRRMCRNIRLKAVRALIAEIMNAGIDIGWTNVVDSLVEVLFSKAPVSVKEEVARALGLLKDQRAVEPLIEVLKNEKNLSVRKAVVMALGEIGDARALEVLAKIAENPKEDASLKKKASKAIERIGKQEFSNNAVAYPELGM